SSSSRTSVRSGDCALSATKLASTPTARGRKLAYSPFLPLLSARHHHVVEITVRLPRQNLLRPE
ncbi:hypothetical protein, partial [Pantoea ananatis]|uniref:hypothetical protein n=1 Tax=Pantoea ananas TaxID=553 RepID=UPI001C64CE74